MNWGEWLDTRALKALSQHASAIVAAIVFFALVGSLLRRVLPPGLVRDILEWIESIVLIGLFLWFGWQMALLLWKGRVRSGPSNCFVAA